MDYLIRVDDLEKRYGDFALQDVSLAVEPGSVVGFVGSMTNTVCVMGSIYLLLAQQYAQVKNVGMEAVFGLVMGTVTGSGVMEAIAAVVLVTTIGKVLLQVGVAAERRRPARSNG